MLTKITLQHFKCFELLRLPISPLTILSGANASGKSSVLQALVLLHQTMREHEWSTRLMLNGDVIRLGTVADVVDELFGRNTIGIGLEDDERSLDWAFSDERDAMSMAVDSVKTPTGETSSPKILKHLLPPIKNGNDVPLATQVKNLTYITAERIGPREVYILEDKQNTPVVGPQGENATSVLYSGRDELVIDALVVQEKPPIRLRQVEARMQVFFPYCSLEIQQIARVNAVTLGLRTSNATGYHRPGHEGFGLTQIFPIIVAALSAKKGDIILIENPEVHLHPAGQAVMGQFLADVVRAGVQVIIETHSDHVLNGIRRAIKSKQLEAEQVAIHFFSPRTEEPQPQVVSPAIDSAGSIDSWPNGFFDQFDKDANYFAGWGE